MIINIFIIVLIFIIFYIINYYLKNSITENFMNYITPFPIDFVYTWKGEVYSNNIRESYNYELKYSLRSIYKNAPWFNNIYILVDPPKKLPSWVKENKKIIAVDTSETFPNKSYLPNSNSNAIESTIVNIKGLSEHYIYMCDDIFIGTPVLFTKFFTYDGKAKVDTRCVFDHPMLKDENHNMLDIKYPSIVHKFYSHIPIPQLKSVVNQFYKTYPDYTEWIRKTQKRTGTGTDICDQYYLNGPCQQIHYPVCKFMYNQNKAVLVNYRSKKDFIFIMNDKMYLRNGYCLLNKIYRIQPMFFCINDDEKDPEMRKKIRKDMLLFFNNYFPDKPAYEK